MAATMAEIKVAGGIQAFYCPLTGQVVFDEDDGFDPDRRHSPHLRVVVDWAGTLWIGAPDQFSQPIPHNAEVLALQDRSRLGSRLTSTASPTWWISGTRPPT